MNLKLLIFCLFLLGASSHASEGPLRVLLAIEDIEFSRQTLVRYQNILKETFDRPVVITLTDAGQIDAKIVDTIMRHEQYGWETSSNLLEVVPGYSLITLGEQDLDSSVVGQLRRPFMMRMGTNSYPLDDMTVAADMLSAGRVDAILDYSQNGALYKLKNDDFRIKEIRSHTSVRVAFRDEELARVLDNSLHALAGVEQNSLRLNEAVKDIQLEDQREVLQWMLIVKQFDPVDNKLHATPEDIVFTEWIQQQWPDTRFSVTHTNTNNAYEKLASEDNVCVLNTGRNAQREDIAIFSRVTFVFLDIRLYAMVGSPSDLLLQKWSQSSDNGGIDLQAFFSQNPSGLIGYYQYLTRLRSYEQTVKPLIDAMPDRFIEIKATGPKKSINLLDMERIDYLIIPPYVLQLEMSDSEKVSKLNGYRHKESIGSFPTFIACSRTEQGRKSIAQLNKALEDPQTRQTILKLYTNQMLSTDIPTFIREFERHSSSE